MVLTTRRKGGRPRVKAMVSTQLGSEVRQARNAKGFSLDRLSKIAGVGLRTIHAIEQGESRHPTEETLRRLASALDIPYRDLALAAYGANGDTPPTPPEGDSPCPPETGRKARTHTASTS